MVSVDSLFGASLQGVCGGLHSLNSCSALIQCAVIANLALGWKLLFSLPVSEIACISFLQRREQFGGCFLINFAR